MKRLKNVNFVVKGAGIDDPQQQLAAAMAAIMSGGDGVPPRHKEATLPALPSGNIYGRRSIFDACAPGDVFGLQVQTAALMQWVGFRPNKYYQRRVSFIDWWGPEGTVGSTATTGATAPCDDPPGWEYGKCGYDLIHDSWYSRSGDPLDPHTVVQDRCETSPRYRLNGVLISDDVEWQMNGLMNTLSQSVRRDFIHGQRANDYEMAGLEDIIKTGYEDISGIPCPRVDSVLVDWAHDDLDGESNGFGNFFDYLDELVTEIEWRASAMGVIVESDMILLTSRYMATCLLDSYACYTTCGVTSSNDITDQALRAQQRAERRSLNGGPLYDGTSAVGYIQLKSGRRLPIMVEDTLDINLNGSGTGYISDIYLLTRRVGSIDVLYGEYLDMRSYEARVKKSAPDVRSRTDATGRFLMKSKEENFCFQMIMGTSPELYLAAPWAQVRISDVSCARARQPLTGDPYQSEYMPGGTPLYEADSQSPFYP